MSDVEMHLDFSKLGLIPPSFFCESKTKTKEVRQAEKEIIQALKGEARRQFLAYARGEKL